MPIKIENPFLDPTLKLRPEVNPFLGKMKLSLENGTLPLLYGPAMKPWAKNWRDWFLKERKLKVDGLVLEIGSHKGDVLVEMAKNHPNLGFIGLDITFKRVVTTAERAETLGLQNVVSLLCNGRALDQIIDESELDGAFIFFPDPWVRKKRQQKNRLVDQLFLKSLKDLIKPGGFLWIKTDHQPYFDDICASADLHGFQAGFADSALITETYTSRFERHFREAGEKTFEKHWVKPQPH